MSANSCFAKAISGGGPRSRGVGVDGLDDAATDVGSATLPGSASWRVKGERGGLDEAEMPIARPAADVSPGEAEAEPAEAMDTVALRRLCGRPWVANFTAECLAVLERRYQGGVPDPEPLERQFRPVMLGEPVTWREVFEDVDAGLAAVEDALGRPECLVPEGRFRLDLRDACAAIDIARLAIVRRECVKLLLYDDVESRQRSWETHMHAVDRAADQAEYYRRLEQLSERWFGMMWRYGKCRAVPEAALGNLGPFSWPLGPGNFPMDQIDMMEAAAGWAATGRSPACCAWGTRCWWWATRAWKTCASSGRCSRSCCKCAATRAWSG